MLTNRELYFKCAGLPFIGIKLNLEEIRKVSTTKNYKNQFKSVLLIHCKNELHVFYKFHFPKNVVRNSIICSLNRLDDLNGHSSSDDLKFTHHKLEHFKKKIKEIKYYIKTPENDFEKKEYQSSLETLETNAVLPLNEFILKSNEHDASRLDHQKIEVIEYTANEENKILTHEATKPNNEKSKDIIMPDMKKKSNELIVTKLDESKCSPSSSNKKYGPETSKFNSTQELLVKKRTQSIEIKRRKSKMPTRPKSLQLLPQKAWNRTRTSTSETEEKSDDQITKKKSFPFSKKDSLRLSNTRRDSSPMINNTKWRLSNSFNRIQGRLRLKSNKEGFNTDDSYETASEELSPQYIKESFETNMIDNSDTSEIMNDYEICSEESIINNFQEKSNKQHKNHFLFSLAIFLIFILSFMSLGNFIFLMTVEENMRTL